MGKACSWGVYEMSIFGNQSHHARCHLVSFDLQWFFLLQAFIYSDCLICYNIVLCIPNFLLMSKVTKTWIHFLGFYSNCGQNFAIFHFLAFNYDKIKRTKQFIAYHSSQGLRGNSLLIRQSGMNWSKSLWETNVLTALATTFTLPQMKYKLHS